jgi:hypothetical protein
VTTPPDPSTALVPVSETVTSSSTTPVTPLLRLDEA